MPVRFMGSSGRVGVVVSRRASVGSWSSGSGEGVREGAECLGT